MRPLAPVSVLDFWFRSQGGSPCFYRPQTKFAKVMFSQVSVCPQGGMHGRGGGLAWQGACIAGGVHGRGHAWQRVCMAGGVHGRGACVAGAGCVWQGGMHRRGCAWQGACMAEGVHGRGCAQQGACVAGAGCVWQGGMHGRGACVVGACMVGVCVYHAPLTCGQYAGVCILLECILVILCHLCTRILHIYFYN